MTKTSSGVLMETIQRAEVGRAEKAVAWCWIWLIGKSGRRILARENGAKKKMERCFGLKTRSQP